MSKRMVPVTLPVFGCITVLCTGVGIVLHVLGRVDLCPYVFGAAVASMAMVFLIVMFGLARAGLDATEDKGSKSPALGIRSE